MDHHAEFVVAQRDDLGASPIVGIFALVGVVLSGAFHGQIGLRLWLGRGLGIIGSLGGEKEREGKESWQDFFHIIRGGDSARFCQGMQCLGR